MIALIPSIDVLEGKVVRLRHGDRDKITYYDVDAISWAAFLDQFGTLRIHIVDLDAAFGGEPQPSLRALPATFPNVRFQLGGGLRTREAIDRAIGDGFEAVVGTLAVENPGALDGLTDASVIVALDIKDGRIATRGWRSTTDTPSETVFTRLLDRGFRRALVTDIGRDGTLHGPGVEALASVASHGFQVQASGGLRCLDDLRLLEAIPGVVGAISGRALLDAVIVVAEPDTRRALGTPTVVADLVEWPLGSLGARG